MQNAESDGPELITRKLQRAENILSDVLNSGCDKRFWNHYNSILLSIKGTQELMNKTNITQSTNNQTVQ